MKKFSFALLITAFSFTGFSQVTEKQNNIRKLLELTGTGKMTQLVVDNMLNAMNTSSQLDSTFYAEFRKQVKVAELMELLLPVYEKYYSDTEIKELIAFYSSPLGKKVIDVLPAITQESMTVGQQWGKEIGWKFRQA